MGYFNSTAPVVLEVNKTNPTFNSTSDRESAGLGAEILDGTGWTSAGWTGDFATGFTHTAGNTSVLSRNIGATGTNDYQVSFTVSAAIETNTLFVTLGNSAPFDLYGFGTDVTMGIKSLSDGDLVITPVSAFNAKITNISVKQITGTIVPTVTIKDASGDNTLEIRNTDKDKYNLFMGLNAGQKNTSGIGNVALGTDILNINTSGFWNIGVGRNILKSNTVGSRNIGIGYQSLHLNISGQRNIGIGTFTLQNNTTGNGNIALGADALDHNTSGSNNIAFGWGAMYSNLTGYSNFGLGFGAMHLNTSGNKNVALGEQSLYRNTTGANNVAVGNLALFNNTTGGENTAVGYGTAQNGTSGALSYNTLIGCSAGNKLVGGAEYNTLIGNKSGFSLTSGDNNTFIGARSGYYVTTGSNNILIGYTIDTPAVDTANYLNIGGAITGNLTTKDITLVAGLIMASLPTTEPTTVGAVWNDAGTLKIKQAA